ncbi:histidine kinase [Streptomyces sp. NPDC001127]|uniref:sensor histidine kinase n=1 Tax=unclassified Streptomyces TaxID=2593676 RepID=UPI0033235CFC
MSGVELGNGLVMSACRALVTRLRSLPRALRAVCRDLFAPGMWPAGRVVGESLLMVVFGLVAAGAEAMQGSGTVRVVGAGLAAVLLCLLRRVVPAIVLLAAAAGSVPYCFFGLTPLLAVTAWSAGRRIGSAGRAAGAFAVAYLLNVGLTQVTLWGQPRSLLVDAFTALLPLATVVVPGLAGRYWSQYRTLTDTLRRYNAQLLRERAMVAGQARMRERQRIAQDMHDSLGHHLTLISVHVGALEVDRGLTGRQREAVGVLREASVAAMHELREVVGLLKDATRRPGHAGEAEESTRGVAGMESLVQASRNAGACVALRRCGDPRPLPPAADHAAYRVVQEGLTNAHKHAPGVPVAIELRYEPDALVIEVANGPASASVSTPVADRTVVSGGQGLTGLGERTRLIGGMVHAGATADGGFRLAGMLPYTVPEIGSPGLSGAPGTTFVDPADDFREQFSAVSPGEGGPVMDGIGLPKELAEAMSENNKTKGLAAGCALAALILLALMIGLAALAFLSVGR